MIFWLVGAIIFLFLFYFYVNRGEGGENLSIDTSAFTKSASLIRENFISSEKFAGYKKGYVFKNDSQGLGYYIDTKNIKF